MRIDGSSIGYPLDRPARPGSAVTPYREKTREEALRPDQPTATSASQGFESVPQARKPEPGSAASEVEYEYMPAHFGAVPYERPLTSRAAQALASYSSTASLASDIDANEVLGLDLYA